MERSQTQYTVSHGLSIACQVMGDGDIDIITAQGMIFRATHAFCGGYQNLRALLLLISGDKGYQTPLKAFRHWMNRGSKKTTVFGFSEGGPMAFLLATTHSSRVDHIVTFGAYGKVCKSPEYLSMFDQETRRNNLLKWLEDWHRNS